MGKKVVFYEIERKQEDQRKRCGSEGANEVKWRERERELESKGPYTTFT